MEGLLPRILVTVLAAYLLGNLNGAVTVSSLLDRDDVRAHGSGKPTCMLLHTTKGMGVSFMENAVGWHGKGPNDEEYQRAMAELQSTHDQLEKEYEQWLK